MKTKLLLALALTLQLASANASEAFPSFSCMTKAHGTNDYYPVEIRFMDSAYFMISPVSNRRYLISAARPEIKKNSIKIKYVPRKGLIFTEIIRMKINWKTGRGKVTRFVWDPFDMNYQETMFRDKTIFKKCHKIE